MLVLCIAVPNYLAIAQVEDQLFSNIHTPVSTIAAKPAGFDSEAGNTHVSLLSAAIGVNKKMGPGLVLKVMKGDQVQLNSFAFYNTPAEAPAPGVNLLPDILGGLTGGIIGGSGGKILPGQSGALGTVISPNVSNFLNNNRPYDNSRPKAYLNWVLFDNQFNMVATNSGVVQVPAGSSKQALVAPLQNIVKNGYLYVYVSNESPQNVYFDDITVKHYSGPLLQEDAYYPYGVKLAGLCDKAALKVGNPYKYNGGSELEDEDGLEYYETFYRKYDAQIGRFTGVDILAEVTYGLTPFQFGSVNPAMFNDPTGALTSGEFQGILNDLGSSQFGGTWSASGGGGTHYFGSNDEAFGWGASYMTANNLWGMSDGWAGSYGEALKNYMGSFAGELVNGLQGYNYVTESFSIAYADKKYEGDKVFNSEIGENFYYAGFGDIFDFGAMEAGYAVHQASLTGQVQMALDGIGMTEIPIISQAAELISAGISFGQGDWAGGAISLGSMIPVGGKFFEGMKVARYAAKVGQTIIGEGMKRVSVEAAKRPGSVILNNMPKFTGTADQVTSQMMTYNRQWILQQMRSGRPILDIGLDATRANPSIFYQMEQNMMRNYLKLHPNAFQVIKP